MVAARRMSAQSQLTVILGFFWYERYVIGNGVILEISKTECFRMHEETLIHGGITR